MLRIETDEVRAFLLDPRFPATPETLRAAGLGAFAYARLPPEDARREALRADYLRSLRRHHQIRDELARPLRSWHDAGIEVLLFKGFHLAEFVYPSPGMRFHGDVDVLVRPEHAHAAATVAGEVGWSETLRRPRFSHEVCGLVGPAGTKVDLHRFALHRYTPWGSQRRITRAVWERSERIAWQGTTVRLPAPADALLVGLILQRLWCDDGHLKPHDLIDSRFLLESVTREELSDRAHELGCGRTLAFFLDRCEPARDRLVLVPSRADRRRLLRIVWRERGPFTGRSPGLALRRLVGAPGLLLDIARLLPGLVTARRRVRAEPDLRELFRGATPAMPRARSSPRRRHRTVRALRWATRILRLNPGGDCLLRSLAIYTALRRQGWPVEFVSGVRREDGRVQGHAWVEYDGRVLPELGESANGLLFRETFRWPPDLTGRGDGRAERVPAEANPMEHSGEGLRDARPDDR